jgi:hypothetical protein
MAIYAVIEANGAIVNSILLEDVSAWQPQGAHTIILDDNQAYQIGGTLIDGVYTAPVVELPQPTPLFLLSISDRQFFQQLAVLGVITQDEALASNAAVIPQPLLDIIDAMPADQQFNAKMIVSGATVFERNNPLTIAIGTAYGWSSAQIDAFFVAAAKL